MIFTFYLKKVVLTNERTRQTAWNFPFRCLHYRNNEMHWSLEEYAAVKTLLNLTAFSAKFISPRKALVGLKRFILASGDRDLVTKFAPLFTAWKLPEIIMDTSIMLFRNSFFYMLVKYWIWWNGNDFAVLVQWILKAKSIKFCSIECWNYFEIFIAVFIAVFAMMAMAALCTHTHTKSKHYPWFWNTNIFAQNYR